MNVLSLSLPPIASPSVPMPLSDGSGVHPFEALIGGQPEMAAMHAPEVAARLPAPPPEEMAVVMVAALDRSAILLREDRVPVTAPEPGSALGPSSQPGGIPAKTTRRSGMPVAQRRDTRPGKVADKPDAAESETLSAALDLPGESPMSAALPTLAVIPPQIACSNPPAGPNAGTVGQKAMSAVAVPVTKPGECRPVAERQAQTSASPLPEAAGVIVGSTPGPPPTAVAEVSTPPSMQPGTVVAERHLDLARGDAWLDGLARDIAATAEHGRHLKFALAPETLGRLDVEVRRGDAGVSVHMAARSDSARDMLSAAQPRLVDEIRAQGVRVTATEIAADTSGFGSDRPGTGSRPPVAALIEANAAPRSTQFEPRKSMADGRYA